MKNDKIIHTAGIFFSIIIIGLSIYLYYLNSKIISQIKKPLVDTKVSTQVDVETKTEIVDYKNTEILVLNATRTKGLAKIYADKLINLGYTKVSTGNYEETTDENLLIAPHDFKDDLLKIEFTNYKFIPQPLTEENSKIQIVIAKN